MTDWTTADIPDQTGRTAVITGANTGLGFETAKALAAGGARVVLAVRDTEKGAQAAAKMAGDVDVQQLDLTSLASIRSAADALKSRYDHIDLLINNAGVMTTPKGTTADGFELQFGTNHLGHFAFTGLLLDKLLDVDGARIVTVSSNGHKMGGAIHWDDLQWERSYSRMGAYSQSPSLPTCCSPTSCSAGWRRGARRSRSPPTPGRRAPSWVATCPPPYSPP